MWRKFEKSVLTLLLAALVASSIGLPSCKKDEPAMNEEESGGEHREPIDKPVNGEDDPNQDQSSAIVGIWVEVNKKAIKYTFDNEGNFERSIRIDEMGEWSSSETGKYKYFDVSDWLKLWPSGDADLHIEEYACTIQDNIMTLTPISGQSNHFVRQTAP